MPLTAAADLPSREPTPPPPSPKGPNAGQRRILAVVTGVVLVAALVAAPFVGSRGDDIDAGTLVAAAASVGTTAESLAFESTSTFSFGGQVGGSYLMTGEVSAGAARLVMEFEGLPVPGFTLLSDGNLLFAEVPEQNRHRVGGKAWMAAPATGDDFGELGDLTQLGLDQFLSGAHGGVTTVGTETVRGVETTHYRVRVDSRAVFQKVLEQQATGGAGTGLAQLAGDIDVDVAPVDVWLDGEQRLRRLEVRLDITAAQASAQMELRHDVFDYGKPVTVELPDSNEVFLLDSVATLQSLLRVSSG